MSKTRRHFSTRPESPPTLRHTAHTTNVWYGFILALLIAVVSWFLGKRLPVVGGPVFGIVLGMLVGSLVRQPHVIQPGVRFASKQLLQSAIILLGGGLSLRQVWLVGSGSVVVMLTTLVSAFVVAVVVGKWLRVSDNLISLVGVGTAICGGSAIAAIAPIISADDNEIAYSISTIFFFNVLAVLIFPPLGHALAMSAESFGLWAGTAINDTSSVVAAGYAFSQAAGEHATIVKLTRTTMIIPIAGLFALKVAITHRRRRTDSEYQLRAIFPWFILWFLLASLLHTIGVIGPELGRICTAIGKFMIIVALAGVGLGANLGEIIRTGVKPLLLGLTVWAAVAATSLLVQHLLG